METLSTWALAAKTALANHEKSIVDFELNTLNFTIQLIGDSLWARCFGKDGEIAFRMIYCPEGALKLNRKSVAKDNATLSFTSLQGKYKINISYQIGNYPILKYTTQFVPSQNLLVPFSPRDIIIRGNTSAMPKGQIHVNQIGTRSGLLYFSIEKPSLGSVLYLQNLTALAKYNQDTETSAGNTVGGIWPEIGFALPPTTDKPLLKNTTYILSDAIIAFDEAIAKNETALTKQYLELLAEVYLTMPKPKTIYQDWPTILKSGLHDLIDSPGCWSQVNGMQYFNAYISDYETPPEVMVQLAVLLPLVDYKE